MNIHTANFMHGHKTSNRKNLHWRKWRPLIFVIVGILGILILWSLFYIAPARALYTNAKDGKNEFTAAEASLKVQHFTEAKDQLQKGVTHFQTAQEAAHKIQGPRFLPVIGRQIRAVDSLLQVGVQAGLGAETLVSLAEKVTAPLHADGNTSFASISSAQKRDVLAAIAQSAPDIQGAKAQLDLAVQYLDAIPEKGLLGPLASAVKPVREQIPQLDKGLENALPAVQVVPAIIGYPDSRSYLFLLQNNTEIRPTGGFIGTYGAVHFSNGEITNFTTHNVYELDNGAVGKTTIDPPAPLQKYLAADHWYFRDSNWSPDFPTAAQEALRFYDLESQTTGQFDGVIAVTPNFISSLMKITGDIKIGGSTYTADNLVDLLEFNVEKGYQVQGLSDVERKQVIGDLAQELFHRLLTLPQSRWSEVWKVLGENVTEKNLLMYLKNTEEQSFVQSSHWAGEVKATNGDYVYVVDANLASLKSDPGVKRSLEYSVDEQDGKLSATLTVHYKNEGAFNWKSTRYRTYVRIYVPQGSTLTSSSGFLTDDKLHNGKPTDPTVTDELGKTVIGGFTSIEPQEEGTLTLHYTLPSGLQDQMQNGQYSLLVQKQPGTDAHGLTLDIHAPRSIQSYSPAETGSTSGKTAHFSTDLQQDRTFSLELHR